ncbi:MAG: hypothetical protein ACFFCZ_13455 [Promethearchaeota archaeon]
MSEKLDFIYLFKPAKKATSLEEYMQSLSAEEKLVMEKHFRYMDKLQETGKILLGGPCLDLAYLILILRVDSQKKRNKLMQTIPLLRPI